MKTYFIHTFFRSWASVAVAGGSALLSGYKALKAGQADKEAAREGAALRRPFYQIQPEYQQNVNVAKEMAGQGFSSAETTAMNQQRERGLSSSILAEQEGGGGPNEGARLAQVFSDSLTSQAAQDAQLHMQNIKFFTDANKDLAGQKNTQWAVNELQPFETKLKEIQDRRIAAQTNQNNAINDVIGSASAAATGISGFMKTNPAKAPATPDLGPYSRNFGLADTGATGFNDPAAGYNVLNPNAAAGVGVPDASAALTAIPPI